MIFVVNGWQGKLTLTEAELYRRISDDRWADYNWIAAPRELARVMAQPGFDPYFATQIRLALLRSFVYYELLARASGGRYWNDPADLAAIAECYNALMACDNEEAHKICAQYRCTLTT